MRKALATLLTIIFVLQALALPALGSGTGEIPVLPVEELPLVVGFQVQAETGGYGEFRFDLTGTEEVAADLVVGLDEGAPGRLQVTLWPVGPDGVAGEELLLALGPIAPGETEALPVRLPPGLYQVEAQLFDDQDQPLAAEAPFRFALEPVSLGQPPGFTVEELPALLQGAVQEESGGVGPLRFAYLGGGVPVVVTLSPDPAGTATLVADLYAEDSSGVPAGYLGRLGPVAPGEGESLSVTLEPGNYQAFVQAVDAGGEAVPVSALYTLGLTPRTEGEDEGAPGGGDSAPGGGDAASAGGDAPAETGGGAGDSLSPAQVLMVETLPFGTVHTLDGGIAEVGLTYAGEPGEVIVTLQAGGGDPGAADSPTSAEMPVGSMVGVLLQADAAFTPNDVEPLAFLGPFPLGSGTGQTIHLGPGNYVLRVELVDDEGRRIPAAADLTFTLEPIPGEPVDTGEPEPDFQEPVVEEVGALPFALTESVAGPREVELTYTGDTALPANLTFQVDPGAEGPVEVLMRAVDANDEDLAGVLPRWVAEAVPPGGSLLLPVSLPPGSRLILSLNTVTGGIGDPGTGGDGDGTGTGGGTGDGGFPAAGFTLSLSAPGSLADGLSLTAGPVASREGVVVRVDNPRPGWFAAKLPGEQGHRRVSVYRRVYDPENDQTTDLYLFRFNAPAGSDLPPIWLPEGELYVAVAPLQVQEGSPAAPGAEELALQLSPRPDFTFPAEGLTLTGLADWEGIIYHLPPDVMSGLALGAGAREAGLTVGARLESGYATVLRAGQGEFRWSGLHPQYNLLQFSPGYTGGAEWETVTVRLIRLDGSRPVTLSGRQRLTDDLTADKLPVGGPRAGTAWMAFTASTTAPVTNIGSYPVHAGDPVLTEPVQMPVGSELSIYSRSDETNGELVEWQLTLHAITAYPQDPIVVAGTLLPIDSLWLAMDLGLQEPQEMGLHVEAAGTARTTLRGSLTSDAGFAHFGLLGADNPETPENDRVADTQVKVGGRTTLQLRLDGETPEALRYRVVVDLPPVIGLVVVPERGGADQPLEVPQGQSLGLVARGELDRRAVPATWKVEPAPGTAGLALGQATIDAMGVLTGVAPGPVKVTATYQQGTETLTATATVTILEPMGPSAYISVQRSWEPEAPPNSWQVSGGASAPYGVAAGAAAGTVAALEWRLNDGDWRPLPPTIKVEGLGTAGVSFGGYRPLDLLDLTGPLSEGRHLLSLRARDGDGVYSDGPGIGTAEFIYDQTPPVIAGVTPAGGSLGTGAAAGGGNGSAGDGSAGDGDETDAGDGTGAGGDATPDATQAVFTIVATDRAGSEPADPPTLEARYRPAGGGTGSGGGPGDGAGTGQSDAEWSRLDWYWLETPEGQEGQRFGWDIRGLSGSYEIEFVAVDGAGNRSEPVRYTYTIGATADSNPPEVSYLYPNSETRALTQFPAMTGDTLPVQFGVSDDANVVAVWLEARRMTSEITAAEQTFAEWQVVSAEVARPADQDRRYWTGELELNLAGQPDGIYQLRLWVRDAGGNHAWGPAQQAVALHRATTPADPPTQVMAQARPGNPEAGTPRHVEITWTAPADGSALAYNVYRQEGEEWVLLGRVQATRFVDTSFAGDATALSYQVSSANAAGAESAPAPAPPASFSDDTDPPRIDAFFVTGREHKPRQMVVVSQTATLNYHGVDDRALVGGLLHLQGEGIEPRSFTLEFWPQEQVVGAYTLDTAALPDGAYTAGLVVQDAGGNLSPAATVTFLVDNTPPAPPAAATAAADPDGRELITVSWEASPSDQEGSPDDDVAGYRLYRLLGSGRTDLGQHDDRIYPDGAVTAGVTYRYRVLAVDWAGNRSEPVETAEVTAGQDQEPPVAYVHGPIQVQLKEQPGGGLAVPVALDGTRSTDNVGIVDYSWDPGDQTPALTANARSGRVTHMYTRAGTFTATLTVRDQAGNSATAATTVTVLPPDAPVLVLKVADLQTGDGVEGVEVMIDGGRAKGVTGSGGLIELAGAPEQTLRLMFFKPGYVGSETAVTLPRSGTATAYWALSPGDAAVGTVEVKRLNLDEIKELGLDLPAGDGEEDPNRHVYKIDIKLELPTGAGGGGGGGGGISLFTSGGQVVGGSGCGACTGVSVGTFDTGEGPPGVVVVQITNPLKWLKEFFEVKVTVLNPGSSGFTLAGNTLTLTIPEGLSLAPVISPDYATTLKVKFPDLEGGQQHVTRWVIRGDKAGQYEVAAYFEGTVQPFGKPVTATFRAADKIEVYGLSALKMEITPLERVENIVPVKVLVYNRSPVDVYGLELALVEDPSILAPGEEPVRRREVLKPFKGSEEVWETIWKIKVGDGELPPLEDLFKFEDPGEVGEVDPNWVHYARGRVVANNGQDETPVPRAVVSIGNRNVALTDEKGEFVAPAPNGGTHYVRVRHAEYAGEWVTRVEIPHSKDGERQEALVESTYHDPDGIPKGYLIHGSLITSFNSALHQMQDQPQYDQAVVGEIFGWARGIIDNSKAGANGEPLGYIHEDDEAALRRMREVVNFVVQNDRQVEEAVDLAVTGIVGGTVGVVQAAFELVDVFDLIIKHAKRFPPLKRLAKWLEEKVSPQLKRLQDWAATTAGQLIISGAEQLLPAIAERSGVAEAREVQVALNEMKAWIEDYKAKGNAAAQDFVGWIGDQMKPKLVEAIMAAHRAAVAKELREALAAARARNWDEMSFDAVSARYRTLREVSDRINKGILRHEEEIIWLDDFLVGMLKTGAESAENLADEVGGDSAAGQQQVDALKNVQGKNLRELRQSLGQLDPQNLGEIKPEDAVAFLLADAEVWLSKAANFATAAKVGPERVRNGFEILWMIFGPGGLAGLDREAARAAFASDVPREEVRQMRMALTPQPNEFLRVIALLQVWLKNPGDFMQNLWAVNLFSPANLYVVDAQGRAVGVDPATGLEVNEIPGALFSGKDSHPQSLVIPGDVGELTIQMVGTGDGVTTLDVTRFDAAGGSASMTFVDPARAGATVTYTAVEGSGDTGTGSGAPGGLTLLREGEPVAWIRLPDRTGVAGGNLELPLTLAAGSRVTEVVLELPYDPTLVTPAPTAAGTFAVVEESAAEGILRLRLSRQSAGGEPGSTGSTAGTGGTAAGGAGAGGPDSTIETVATIQLQLLAAGVTTLDLLGGQVELRDAGGNLVPHARSGASIIAGDGSVRLLGRVSDAEGLGMAGVQVSLLAADGEPIATATTDELGSYTLTGVQPGTYRLRAEGEGLAEPLEQDVTVGRSPDAILPPLTLALDAAGSAAPDSTPPATGIRGDFNGDFNGDGLVDIADYVLLVRRFGPAAAGKSFDLNGDGEVNLDDLQLLLPTQP